MIGAAIHGFILAFPLIMPLGAQNVYIFNQGAAHRKFWRTLPVVATAGICDTMLISLAVTGVSLVVLGNLWIKTILMGCGTLFLIYMGWLTWSSKPEIAGPDQPPASLRKTVFFTLSVSLLNPHAILDTVGVIGTNSLKYLGAEKLAFATATVAVSWLWFMALAVAGKTVGSLDKSGQLLILLNKVSALIMWGVAVFLAVSLLQS